MDGGGSGLLAQTSKGEQKPLKVRLIRIRGKKGNDVWLVTNVLDPKRLPVGMAGKYYRMRWGNEGYFRSYKYTLKKVKVSGRTEAAVHREVLGSMLPMYYFRRRPLPHPGDPLQ